MGWLQKRNNLFDMAVARNLLIWEQYGVDCDPRKFSRIEVSTVCATGEWSPQILRVVAELRSDSLQ